MTKRIKIEYLEERFSERGYILVSKDYKNNKQKLDYICPNGHCGSISWNSFSKGHGCPNCYGNAVVDFIRVKKTFSSEGYEIISSEYVNSSSSIKCSCPKGHVFDSSWSKFSSGYGCPFCAGNVKYSYEQVRKIFEGQGFRLISKEYINNKNKLRYCCPKGHFGSVSLHSFLSGTRCGVCYGNKKIEFEQVKEEFILRGFVVLGGSYVNSQTPLRYKCSNGHINSISLSNLKCGWRCPDCSGNKKKSIEFIRECLEQEGYVLESKKYINSKTKLISRCPKGHRWVFTWSDFNRKHRCGACFKSQSKAEKELLNFVRRHTKEEVISGDLEILEGKELDIYIPSKNLAIEYCGLYWHSEISGRKERKYHRSKYDLCKERGVRLITIFEDEYLNRPEVVKSRILNALGEVVNKVYARNCIFVEINRSEAQTFLNLNHIQGYSGCSYRYALKYRGSIVGVMTFGKPSRGNISNRNNLELKRLAFKVGLTVVGGPSKLFKNSLKHIRTNLSRLVIKSYCDLRWASADKTIYDILGFSLISETKYTPHYLKGGIRYRNQTLRKTPEERKTGLTEWELRKAQGYDRIWDCGHRTYLYEE